MTKAQFLKKNDRKQLNLSIKGGFVEKSKFKKLKNTKTNEVSLLKKKQKLSFSPNNINESLPKYKNKCIQKKKIKSKGFDSNIDNVSYDDSDKISKADLKNKGIKMFKGLKTNNKTSNIVGSKVYQNISQYKNNKKEHITHLKDLLKSSINDDSDNDDFDKNLSYIEETTLNDLKHSSSSDENDEPGLKALLGESLVDDDDDDDFKVDDDDDYDDDISDESDEEATKDKIMNESKLLDEQSEINYTISNAVTDKQSILDARTIFVGNVPCDTTKKTIEKLFKSCGKIENIRIRGVVPSDNSITFKVATISKKIHPKFQSMYFFIVFKEESSVKAALKLNGHKLQNNILRVDLAKSNNKDRNKRKSIFVGNLPLDITEDELRAHFISCGNIESVRIVRNRNSGTSIGIGYVNFIEEDSVNLALDLNDTLLKSTKLRVKIYCPDSNRIKIKHKESDNKKIKKNECKIMKAKNSEKKERKEKMLYKQLKNDKLIEKKNNSSFHGQKTVIKTLKQYKKSKMDKKKAYIAKKLVSVKELTKLTC